MQSHRVMGCAKHFPGHGDTDTDSHLDLPILVHNRKRLDDIELFPFKKLIKDSLLSVMVAHLNVPVYDDRPNRPSTLSKYVITDLLQRKLGFEGLIFTDALNMKGVAKFFKPGNVEVLALEAGNDILLFPENVPLAVSEIKNAIQNGDLKVRNIDQKVKKVLLHKFWSGLNNYKPIQIQNLTLEINSTSGKIIRDKLYQKSITLLKNEDNILPISVKDSLKYALLCLGKSKQNEFINHISGFKNPDIFTYSDYNLSQKTIDSLLPTLQKYPLVLVSYMGLSGSKSKNYGLSNSVFSLVENLQNRTKVLQILFGNAYSLKNFSNAKNILCAYEDVPASHKAVAQAIFGVNPIRGKLPVNVNKNFSINEGLKIDSLGILSLGSPFEVEMNELNLLKIDSIALKAIQDGAMPGCQILVAKSGKIIYNKNFGYYTYSKKEPVTDRSLYDIASITKVAGTLQAIMFLYERGFISLDSSAGFYMPELKGSNKEKLIIRDILTHQSGLWPFLEHWKKTQNSDKSLSDQLYCDNQDDYFPIFIAPGIYSAPFVKDSIWNWTISSKLVSKDKDTSCYPYKYSDIGFYLLKTIAEKKLNMPIDIFLEQIYYKNLGLKNTFYNPLNKTNIQNIAPTEIDRYFRNNIVRGTVHDQGAAMMGGVAGHAGLFSNVKDLAILFQMQLQKGYYGGIKHLQQNTIFEFRRRQYMNNRRGLGWDKPELAGGGGASVYASAKTFGHSGFTGTCVWIDPTYDLMYIFLSNRTYPFAENNKLVSLNIRTKIHDQIYLSIINFKK